MTENPKPQLKSLRSDAAQETLPQAALAAALTARLGTAG